MKLIKFTVEDGKHAQIAAAGRATGAGLSVPQVVKLAIDQYLRMLGRDA